MEFCKKLDLTGVEITGKWKADIPPMELSKKYLRPSKSKDFVLQGLK